MTPLPSSMRAVVLDAVPAPPEALVVRERPVPQPELGWVLDEDQLELHEDHLHIGYRSEDSTSNTR